MRCKKVILDKIRLDEIYLNPPPKLEDDPPLPLLAAAFRVSMAVIVRVTSALRIVAALLNSIEEPVDRAALRAMRVSPVITPGYRLCMRLRRYRYSACW